MKFARLFSARPCSPEDRPEIIELENLIWGPGEPGTAEYFDWQYGENPAGQALTLCIHDETGKVVSHQAAVPLPFLIAGRRRLGGMMVNCATHPHFRRKGLSEKAARELVELARQAGMAVLLSVPNQFSHSLFTDKLHFAALGKPWLMVKWIDPGLFIGSHGLPRLGKVLSAVNRLVSRRRSNCAEAWKKFNIRNVEDLREVAIENLWEKTGLALAADAEWLRWRYIHHPTRKYEVVLAGDPESPQALMVYQVMEYYHKAYVMDFFAHPDVNLEVVKALVLYVTKKCAEKLGSGLWSLATPRSRKAELLRKSGFWVVRGGFMKCPRIVFKEDQPLGPAVSLADLDVSYGSLINYE